MNKAIFFKEYRNHLDKDRKLTQKEVDALDLFLDSFLVNKDYFTVPQWAYVFATAFHETAHTFEPVREAFHLSDNWRKNNLRYYPYYGRGYVQLTWDYNYKKYSEILNINILNNPDRAMEHNIAFKILIHGMKNGIYTGKRLDRYINENRKSYLYARFVVNGIDKRELIANYAVLFEEILYKSI
tara:strand:- start:670 stop:1221 length:552 start_codon:yes stop_codon:yes gene_type:complete